ncbi:MAG: tetratricopeptide repeat protein [Alphaproteobacteria bacterium]|nr:tetratricopeptide repeat protein [Alphaproteobacteria bacterium]
MTDGLVADRLRAIGQGDGVTLELAEAALLLGALDRPDADLDAYRRHLAEIAGAGGGPSTAELAGSIAAVNGTLYDQLGYRGDADTYDDPRNANLTYVIDRRRGLPVALGILHIHAARARGLRAYGLNTPGHFLTELGNGRHRVICDPFNGGEPLNGADLRRAFDAEPTIADALVAGAFPPMADRDVLLRLQNNIKTRALDAGDHDRAIQVLESMALVAPASAPIWRELGECYAATDRLRSAIAAMERSGDTTLLGVLRRRLN